MKIDPRIVAALKADPQLIPKVLGAFVTVTTNAPDFNAQLVGVLTGQGNWRDLLKDNGTIVRQFVTAILPELSPELLGALLAVALHQD